MSVPWTIRCPRWSFDLSSAQDRAAPPVPDLVRARGSAPRPAHCPDHGLQILGNRHHGPAQARQKYLDSFPPLGGTPLQMLRHVLIPAALPDAMTALKVASGTAVAVLFMAESFATRRGLGFLIMDAWGRDRLEMFTGILAMSLLGVALYELCNVLECAVAAGGTSTWRGNADDARGNALRGGWRGVWRAVRHGVRSGAPTASAKPSPAGRCSSTSPVRCSWACWPDAGSDGERLPLSRCSQGLDSSAR